MQIFCYSLVTSRVLQNMSGEIEFDEIGTVGVKKCMQIHAISTCFLVKVFFFSLLQEKRLEGKEALSQSCLAYTGLGNRCTSPSI